MPGFAVRTLRSVVVPEIDGAPVFAGVSRYVSFVSVTTPGRYVSCEVPSASVVLVALFGMKPLAVISSASMPSWLT